MSRQEQQWTYIERGDNSRIVAVDTDVTLASGLNIEDAKYIIELHDRERKFQSSLVRPLANAHPFVIETLKREGAMTRYRVSRLRGGGVYSDEFLEIKDAEQVRDTLECEDAKNEQLRYRIWKLEKALKEMCDEWEDVIPTHIYDGDEPKNSEARELLNRSRAVLNGEHEK